jgi:holo-[acyl-carrier protein] synthase
MKGIGTDVVTVGRIQTILARTPAFAGEVFTDRERSTCRARREPARAFAARFAAKESFLKALGLGLWDGVSLRDIEVQEEEGRPRLCLGPSAQAALARAGGGAPRLSLSTAGDVAMALVVVP